MCEITGYEPVLFILHPVLWALLQHGKHCDGAHTRELC
jgi:hypothetical protein